MSLNFLKTKNQKLKTNSGFTLIELLVAIMIFGLGMLSVYLLIFSSLSSVAKSKNEIIVANIAREKLELIKNIRNTNWIDYKIWNKLDSAGKTGEFLTGGYYIIENNFESKDENGNPVIKIKKLSSSFSEDFKKIISPEKPEDSTRLCLDNQNRYTSDCSSDNQKTIFYSYIKVEPLKSSKADGTKIDVENALKIESNIITTQKGFTKYSISTIITDWKK